MKVKDFLSIILVSVTFALDIHVGIFALINDDLLLLVFAFVGLGLIGTCLGMDLLNRNIKELKQEVERGFKDGRRK